MTETTYTPAVFITGADERGNLFAFWKIYSGEWIDAYNMCQTDEAFINKHVLPFFQTVQFSEAVMTRQEWLDNGCPMRMTVEQIAQWVEVKSVLDWVGDDRKWDFTPMPKDMPILDIDNIDEIPF